MFEDSPVSVNEPKRKSRRSSVKKPEKVVADLKNVEELNWLIEKFAAEKNQGEEDERSSEEGCDEWEKVSVGDAKLEDDYDPFKQKWKQIEAKYFMASATFREYKTYKLKPMIVKANDDLRQEVLALQLMRKLKKIFKEARLNLYLRPY